MQKTLSYAFLDESGTVGVPGGTHFLVIGALISQTPREIERPIRRALKKYGPSLASGEIKATDFEESGLMRLLKEIARENIEVVATIVDQRAILRPPEEKEDIYRFAVARTVRRLVERYPHVQIVLDKRYTRSSLRDLLEESIRFELEGLPRQLVLIRQENSSDRKELQAADVIAWAFFKKYERNDDRFYNLFSFKVVDEQVIADKRWK
ncbi:MAG: DUF3800 domain-containing protein [Chloroflexota bacterium]